MFVFRLVHKDVGADQCNNMLSKLEEDAEVAYLEYDKAVKAEDRAQNYVNKVLIKLNNTNQQITFNIETRVTSRKGSK